MDRVFHNPEWFFVGIGFLIFYSVFLWWKRKKPKAILVSVFDDLLSLQKKSWRRMLPWIHSFFIISISISVFFVLARPQILHDHTKIQKTGVDIFLALDVSESMLAEDLTPNRLEAAKTYIQSFIEKVTTDRVGLLVFAGKPFTQSPLTFDYGVLSYYLKDISTQSVNQRVRGLNGTAIGDAILLGLGRFRGLEERTRVLVLLTDGDANVGIDPLIAAEKARAEGTKIYTIGLGKKEGAFIPIGVQNGEKIYARNQDGSFVKTTFNPEKLKKISDITGGKFFHAETNKALEESFAEIQELEKTELESEVSIQYSEEFMPYAFLTLFFMILYGFFVFYIPFHE